MATETESKTKTVEQVRELLAQGKNAKEISEATGKTLATVYVHIRNIKGSTGKRGRPPKADKAEGNGSGSTSTGPRKRPPISASTGQGTASSGSSNGHAVGDEFPLIKEAIQAELDKARNAVAKLEGMLSTIS